MRFTLVDREIIFAAALIRAVAVSLTGILLGLYLTQVGFAPGIVGTVIAAGLAGGATAALVATFYADRLGRRRFLTFVALLSAAGGLAVIPLSNAAVMGAAAFLGMLNGMGKDRGAFVVVEQAILPSTVTDEERTHTFALYNVMQGVGAGAGALLASVPGWLTRLGIAGSLDAMRLAMGLYAALMVLSVLLYLGLSAQVEVKQGVAPAMVSPQSRRTVFRLSALFSVDSLGGGFLTQSLVALFFAERFGVGPGEVGALFFGAHIANTLSQFGSSFLGRRIGLINTMVFTHVPSGFLMAGVAFAPNLPIAVIFFLLRESLVQMDVPARQSYVMAIVKPEERTFAAGVTGLVRLGGWALAPGFAGLLMEGPSLGSPLIVGAALKILYDVLLYRAFAHLKPPEEQRSPKPTSAREAKA